jgi:hypothetical protein
MLIAAVDVCFLYGRIYVLQSRNKVTFLMLYIYLYTVVIVIHQFLIYQQYYILLFLPFSRM